MRFPKSTLRFARLLSPFLARRTSLRQQTVLSVGSNMVGDINLLTATASELQARLTNHSVTSRELVRLYLRQISQYNAYLKAVIAVAPEDLLTRAAEKLDDERARAASAAPSTAYRSSSRITSPQH